MNLIEVTELAVGYDKKPVVSNLNFVVQEKDYLTIVGENGAGKSTLIKTLLNLLVPTSGSVKYGKNLTARDIGYLPQQTQVQKDFPASVEEIVLSGCLNRRGLRPFYKMQERNAAEYFMKQVGILDLKKRCYRELSGGQQQRVLLARALCASNKMLLLDEPVAGLDPIATKEMYELIAQINQNGVAILMISHDIDTVMNYTKKVLHVAKKSVFYECVDEYTQSHLGNILQKNKEVPND